MKGNEEAEVAGWGRFNNDPAVCAVWDPQSEWKKKKKVKGEGCGELEDNRM